MIRLRFDFASELFNSTGSEKANVI